MTSRLAFALMLAMRGDFAHGQRTIPVPVVIGTFATGQATAQPFRLSILGA